jgi:hypothetical protein
MAANPQKASEEIEAMTAGYVDTLIRDFILPHAFEFYRSAEDASDGERLRKIASWILTSELKTVRARDLTRQVRPLRGVGVMDLHTALSPLVAAGWLEPETHGPLNRAWRVMPIVATQFEQQRMLENERKELISGLMGSPRKKS